MRSSKTTASPYKGGRVKFHDFQEYLGLYRDLFIGHSCGMELDHPCPVILDCGANLEVATLYFKRRFPRARIVAFEPNPDMFALLQENISMNCLADVSAEKVAVAAQEGEATFVRPTIADPGSFITHNGVPDGVDSVTVPTVRLSTAVNRLGSVDLLKLDIEGSEYEVLGELEQTRAIDKIKACIIEYHAHKCPNPIEDVVSLLSRNHFPYRLRADWKPWFEPDDPHIVMIYAKKSF
jgi:FkbM family methyltransferase